MNGYWGDPAVKKAVIVGISDYERAPLRGCAADAEAVATLLEKNAESPRKNFEVMKQIGRGEDQVTRTQLMKSLRLLFSGTAETALFYFSGHGIFNADTSSGYLVTQDGEDGNWGVALTELLALANKAHPAITSTVIILDCCQSGAFGSIAGLGDDKVSHVGPGVTILSASDRDQIAKSENGQGVFSALLVDALSGSAADILGRITPASIYTHIDQSLGAFAQRPIYKANVQEFITLRNVPPKVPPEVLSRLPEYFPTPEFEFPLNPSFEPDRECIPDRLKGLPVDPQNTEIFSDLQRCNRHGLVEPIGTPHMFYAAIESKSCRLTALGRHFRKLACDERI